MEPVKTGQTKRVGTKGPRTRGGNFNHRWTQRGRAWQSRNQKEKRANRGIRRIRGKGTFALAQTICPGSENFHGMKLCSQLANKLEYGLAKRKRAQARAAGGRVFGRAAGGAAHTPALRGKRPHAKAAKGYG